MRRDLERRLLKLESRRAAHAQPLVVVIDPIEADGSQGEVYRYRAQGTGTKWNPDPAPSWDRLPDESMPDFQRRVEAEADALPGRPLVIMLTPEDWPTPKLEE